MHDPVFIWDIIACIADWGATTTVPRIVPIGHTNQCITRVYLGYNCLHCVYNVAYVVIFLNALWWYLILSFQWLQCCSIFIFLMGIML